MAVFVGPLLQVLPGGRGKFAWAAQLTADDLVELLIFADRIGLQRYWLIKEPVPHFELTPGLHKKALKQGALTLGDKGKKRMKAPLFEGLS